MDTATDYGWGGGWRESARGEAISAEVSTAQASITPSAGIEIDVLSQNPIGFIISSSDCRSMSGRAMSGASKDNNSNCPVGFLSPINTQFGFFLDDQIQPLVVKEFSRTVAVSSRPWDRSMERSGSFN